MLSREGRSELCALPPCGCLCRLLQFQVWGDRVDHQCLSLIQATRASPAAQVAAEAARNTASEASLEAGRGCRGQVLLGWLWRHVCQSRHLVCERGPLCEGVQRRVVPDRGQLWPGEKPQTFPAQAAPRKRPHLLPEASEVVYREEGLEEHGTVKKASCI